MNIFYVGREEGRRELGRKERGGWTDRVTMRGEAVSCYVQLIKPEMLKVPYSMKSLKEF